MNIKIYTVSGCSYCIKLKRLLDRNNLPYIEQAVKDTQEFKSKYPTCNGFPFTTIDGEVTGGIVETAKFLLDRGLVKRRR